MDERALRTLDAAMVRLADGDRDAATLVFQALWPELVSFAERALGRGPDADDAAQEALEKIFSQSGDYNPQHRALAWALAIVGWECRTVLQRRRRRREQPLEPASAIAETGLNPEAVTLEQRLFAALRESMAGLSPQDQATLHEAFAEEGNSMTPLFRKRKERALSRLRNAWRRIHGD